MPAPAPDRNPVQTPGVLPSLYRPQPENPVVVAVVVSFNRRALLEKTLAGIAAGAVVPDQVVVVENASTDGTREYLEHLEYPLPLDVVPLARNVGGAGGFTVGIDRALHVHAADLVWVMDDDTEPLEQTLCQSMRAWREYAQAPDRRPAFLASSVRWTDGREHPMNSMIERIGAGPRRRRMARAVGARSIRSGSFVSLLMDAAAMRRAGLPICDYFIWNDDFEYSTRLARTRDALLVPESVVVHHTQKFGTTDVDPGPRFFHDVRNKLWVFTRSQSLAPWEKVLYSGATARLWWRTWQNSPDRRALLGHGLRGVRAALRPPRSSAEVLEGLYDLAEHRFLDEGPRPMRLKSQAEAQGQFSLLMSVYAGDRPEYLRAAVASSTWEQQRPPQELVLVQDGPVPQELARALDQAAEQAEQAGIRVQRLVLEENLGLAAALNAGLNACSFRVVARADADDLSLPERFARQVPLVVAGDLAVLGSAMEETDQDGTVEALRSVETDPAALERIAHRRNPLCHPTVVFDAQAVHAVGGYEEIPGAEDYGLWVRMLRAGYRLGNLPEPLVRYRAGAGAWERRGGAAALRRELVLQSRLRSMGFVGPVESAVNVLVRGGYRLFPTGLRRSAYRALVGHRGAPSAVAQPDPREPREK